MNHIIPRCRICNADETHQHIRAEFVYGGREEHNFWQCDKCDAVYLFPLISEEEEARFYKQEFEKFMATRSGQDQVWSEPWAHINANQGQLRRRWPFLLPHLISGQDLLEIGCSSGFMLNAFRDFGLNCIGIEPSGIFFDFLMASGHEVYTSIAEMRQNTDKKVDLIVHFFVLEHIRDPYAFFSDCLNLLKDGGKIIAEVPCVNDPLTNLYEIPAFEKFYWSISHHYYYNPKSLGYVLDRLKVKYEMLPEQRYDLSNHLVWMSEGKPGGQGRYNHVFSKELVEQYKQDLRNSWNCDTIFLYVYR